MPNACRLTMTALLLACLCLAPACGGGKQPRIAPPSVQQQLRAAQSYLQAGNGATRETRRLRRRGYQG